MEAYSGGGRSIKHESDGDSSGSPMSDRRSAAAAAGATDAENMLDVQQQIQQLLAASSAGVTSSTAGLLSPLHFLQASGGTTVANSLPIPWNMMPQYQMMLLAGQNVTGEDGHVVVMPSDGTGKESGRSSASISAQQQQQLFDAASLQMVLQQQLNAAAAAGGEQALVAQMNATAAANAADQQQLRQQMQQQQQRLQQQQQQQQDASKPSPPKPPKKPLTPYMMFSKTIWPQVKAANTHLSSVTEIGAIIGSLWRELGPDEKLQYNEQFSRDKVRYDEELRAYLKTNGLHPSDLIKARSKKVNRLADNRLGSVSHQPPAATHQAAARTPAAASSNQQMYQAEAQHRVTSGGDAAAGDASLPNFSQAWAGQPLQQLLAQMGLAGQVYANSDGTISVDNANLANLLALQPQLLQQAQIYTEQQQGAHAKQTTNKDSWQQNQTLVHPNGAATNGPSNSEEAVGASQYTEYYTVNAQGQLVKHVSPAAGNVAEFALRISQLENELIRSQSALHEKTQENDRLKQELNEAFRLVTEYRQQHEQSIASATSNERSTTVASTTSGSVSAANATTCG